MTLQMAKIALQLLMRSKPVFEEAMSPSPGVDEGVKVLPAWMTGDTGVPPSFGFLPQASR